MSMPTNIKLKKFRLSNTAVSILKGNKDLRNQLAGVIGCKESGVARYLQLNKDTYDLVITRPNVVSFISESTGLTEDQILESVEV